MERKIVIDANITIATVILLPYSEQVDKKLAVWQTNQVQILVPYLWEYECVSALRRAVSVGLLSNETAIAAVAQLSMLELQKVEPSRELNERSLHWAAALGQARAYDAQYLSLAEMLQCEFWTADERAWRSAGQLGINWVRWIGERT